MLAAVKCLQNPLDQDRELFNAGNLPKERVIPLFQGLISTGIINTMGPQYQKVAEILIQSEVCYRIIAANDR